MIHREDCCCHQGSLDAGFGPCRPDPLRPLLASLLVGRSLNHGLLPAMLGLSKAPFQALWIRYFPGAHLNLQDGPGEDITGL